MTAQETDLNSDPLLAGAPVHEGYKVLGGVVLYQKLGQGGMGAVYRGRHLRLNVDVAVKVMDPPAGIQASRAGEFVRRFIREAQTAAAVQHPNLIRVYDVNAEGGVNFLIMDFVDGESATDRLTRKRRLSEAEAVEIALGAAEGLAAAHEQGIVHRDVKPDNIMLDRKGRVRVADLGLAKAFADQGTDEPSMLTRSAASLGTPYYMPPEQFESARDVGPEADVWALGVTLYHLLTGKVPWEASSIFALMKMIAEEPMPDPKTDCTGLSDGVCAVIRRAVRKDPAERYADCAEFARALHAHLGSIRSSSGSKASVLPDPAAGSTKMAVVTVTPPPSKTLTLIAAAALRESGGEKELSEAPTPAPAERRAGPSAVSVLVALFLLLLLGGGGAAAYYKLVWLPQEAERRVEKERLEAQAEAKRKAEAERVTAAEDAKRQAEDAKRREEAAKEAARREKQGELALLLNAAQTFREAGLLDKASDKLVAALAIEPGHAEATKLLAEVRRDSAAQEAVAAAYEDALAAVRKEKPDVHTRRIAIYRSFLPKVAGSRYQEILQSKIAEEMDALLLGPWVKVVTTSSAMTDIEEKIRYLEHQRERFGGTSYLKQLEVRISAAKTQKATGAFKDMPHDVASRFDSLCKKTSNMKHSAKIIVLTSEMPRFAGTRYEKLILGMIYAARRALSAKSKLGPPKAITLDLGGGVAMEFVLVPAGEFMMGSPKSEAKRDSHEGPQHRVRITCPFYMGKYEVTQSQYERIMGTNPSHFKGTNLPVEMVSWDDAAEFCGKLSQRTGKTARLPTEAEWEYACRAGTTTPFHFGESLSSTQAYFSGAPPTAARRTGTVRQKTTSVGSLAASVWGLHDMHGNVWEWCSDWYDEAYYAKSQQDDPTGPESGSRRVIRGGAWNMYGSGCRSASRYGEVPSYRYSFLGARVVVVAPGQ